MELVRNLLARGAGGSKSQVVPNKPSAKQTGIAL
jgi:hypothetical protein